MTLHTLLKIISGAKYSGVPHSVHVRPLTRFAKPKSVTYERELRCFNAMKIANSDVDAYERKRNGQSVFDRH